MALRRSPRKRNPGIAVIVLPIAIFMWIIGWCLYWVGSRHKTHEVQTGGDKDFVSVIAAVPDEQEVRN